jgi:hypothetical protein
MGDGEGGREGRREGGRKGEGYYCTKGEIGHGPTALFF